MNFDRAYKELIVTFFMDFVNRFLPDVAAYVDPESLEFLDKEIFTDVVRGERHEADILVKARFRGEDAFFLIHIENQASAQAGFAERMFRYFARLYENHDLPVYPVAIFSFERPLREEPTAFRVQFPGLLVNEFHFRAIQLNRLNWRDYLNEPNPVAAALMTRMNIAPEDRPRVKLEGLRMIATLRLDPARTRLLSSIVDVNLLLTPAEEVVFARELEESGLQEKEEVMEIVTSWERQGIQKGLVQGRQEGRQEGAADVLLPLLRRRVGALSEAQEQAVRLLSLERLQSLGEALLEFRTGEDLTAWLRS